MPRLVHLILAAAVSGPLLYAGASKLLDASRFVATIPKFGIVLLRPSEATARAVGGLELLAGALLLLLVSATSALVGGIVYLCLASVMARALFRGAAGDCGCFGALGGRIDAIAVVRNLVLAAAALGLAAARASALVADYEFRSALILVIAIGLGGAVVDTLLEIREPSE